MEKLIVFFANRNLLLVFAVVLGIVLPNFAINLKPFSFWVLAVVMLFSLTAISNKAISSLKNIFKPLLLGIFYNHLIFGTLIIVVAYFFSFDANLFYGFIVIAASPPGVAIIPFTSKLNGDIEYSIIATFGAFLASVFLSPLLIKLFSGSKTVDSLEVLKSMIMLIIIPFILSRFLLFEKLNTFIVKSRGKIVDYGFAIIIYISVGLNSSIFYGNYLVLIKLTAVFVIVMFLGGKILEMFLKNKQSAKKIISSKFIFAIKSSGFSVVTSIQIFGDKAAIPATIMSIMVLVYLLVSLIGKKEHI